jgi:hypothetical protein
MPSAGFSKPIWLYNLKTLKDDLSVHLVYGAATTATCRAPRRTVRRACTC